jgi:NhaP-type Na+/H+ or K+/H+ antiporter
VALQLVAESVGIGVALGVALTWLAVRLLRVVNSRGWMTDSWEQITLPALAVACFGLTQWLGGSGFIACFVGGLCFGAMEREGTHARLLDAEGVGDTMALLTWVAFGAAVVGQGLLTLTWQVVLYAFLSLTIIRMLPVYLALAGLSLGASEKLFAGWFGPRGLASIVFAVIVLEEKLPGGGTIIDAVVAVIVLSVLFHGLSASPLIADLAARMKAAGNTSR